MPESPPTPPWLPHLLSHAHRLSVPSWGHKRLSETWSMAQAQELCPKTGWEDAAQPFHRLSAGSAEPGSAASEASLSLLTRGMPPGSRVPSSRRAAKQGSLRSQRSTQEQMQDAQWKPQVLMAPRYLLEEAQHSPVSQLAPLKPGRHRQLKLLTPLMQVAPFWHGWERHSSTSERARGRQGLSQELGRQGWSLQRCRGGRSPTWHLFPVKPARQEQV